MNRTPLYVASFIVASLAALACNGTTTPDGSNGSDEGLSVAQSNYTEEPEDKAAIAKIRAAVQDVNVSHVKFAASVAAPKNSVGGHSANGVRLGGVDWFQKWSGGVNADHSWSNGTELGKRCMWASLLRFEAISKDLPDEVTEFMSSYSAWGGGFYNWVDDYSKSESGDASQARLWAWRTGLTKWISATAKDGSCHLPTRSGLIKYVATCKEKVAGGGEMQGCNFNITPDDDEISGSSSSSGSGSSTSGASGSSTSGSTSSTSGASGTSTSGSTSGGASTSSTSGSSSSSSGR
jgi:hypothetical protein